MFRLECFLTCLIFCGAFSDQTIAQDNEATRIHIQEENGQVCVVSLNGTRIDDAAIQALKNIENKFVLELSFVDLDDSDLNSIWEVKNVAELLIANDGLGMSQITDTGLLGVSRWQNLELLHVPGKGISDSGLKLISEIKGLRELVIDNSTISNSSIRKLHSLANLKSLSLQGTSINDDAIKDLSKMKNLLSLNVCGTDLSAEGVEKLRRQMPNCNIFFWNPQSSSHR